ncbi:MAG: arsenate reductase (glutaredoxin) [Flavobacteriaceae bacterium]|jgi:arsenate reductase
MHFTIYHNPRCRKSREALQYLEEKKVEIEVVKYLDLPIDQKTLEEVLTKIGLKPSEIVRKNEPLWKKQYATQKLTEDQILALLIEHPKLIERPIVTTSNSGVMARPLESLIEFMQLG